VGKRDGACVCSICLIVFAYIFVQETKKRKEVTKEKRRAS